ncbi:MAG: MaoC family dehydratase N-terminal domain-containing protein, partial [Acidimicrobiia bacterium]
MSDPTLHIGLVVGPYVGRIDPDAAQAYALATNDPNPAYFEGDAVPPVYTVALILPALHEGIRLGSPPDAIPGVRGGVHGEHDVFFHQRVRQGMALRWTSETYCATQTGAGTMVTQRLVLTDEHDAPVVEHLWSSLYLGGKIDAQLGPPLRDHTFPDDARRRPLGSHAFEVTGDQSFRYAGASTDHAPMHVDDEAARRGGSP